MLGTEGGEEDEPGRGAAVGECGEEVDCCRVGPVEVLKDEDEGLSGGDFFEGGAEVAGDAVGGWSV